MSLKFGACTAFAATLFGLALTAAPAHAYVEAGMLSCRSPGPTGYIVFSSRIFDCVFMPSSGAPPQFYQANISRFGAQLGFTNDVALAWAVFSATSRVGPGALAGGYIGASAGAAIGIGACANGLVGGLGNASGAACCPQASASPALAADGALPLQKVVPPGPLTGRFLSCRRLHLKYKANRKLKFGTRKSRAGLSDEFAGEIPPFPFPPASQ